jgi:glycosyltransferase involved in cell wall biosynthesis
MKKARRLIAGSRVGIEEYVALGADARNVTFIHPPLAIEEFEELPPHGTFRHRFGIGANPLVMFLGRINWIKGLDFLVESFARLLWERRDVLLVIVGPDDGYRHSVEELVARLGIQDNVLFTGFLGGWDKLAALSDADVVVQPSVYEQTARMSLEAIMCDTPIIVSKNTGAGEIIAEMDGGLLVDYGDTAGLLRAIDETLVNPAEARARTQKAGEHIRANFSLDNRTERFEEVYRDAIAASAKS